MRLPADSQTQGPFPGLRALANCGGCAAKADPTLVALLAGLAAGHQPDDPDVLAGLRPFDDAAVYKLDGQRALVATVDFFPPLVDDPADYGAVAAANALSDIYAMGGEVAFALVISGFPDDVPQEVVAAATGAAAAVVAECGGQILGGHSIRCQEPVFGLCALGFVHPEKVWRKAGARAGDLLMLSKSLGTGLLLAEGSSTNVATAIAAMRQTNRSAALALSDVKPSAVTDVTGFGLAGHALEIAQRSGLTVHIRAARVPALPGALAAARTGACTSADARTRAACVGQVRAEPQVPKNLMRLLYDPQTSGGLLAAVQPGDVAELKTRGFTAIGTMESGPAEVVVD